MIKKITRNSAILTKNEDVLLEIYNKINELVDAVNNQQIQLNNHECRLLDLQNRITALDDPTYHETDQAENGKSSKIEQDPYAEQRKWIRKLCWFWDYERDNASLGLLTDIYEDEDDTPFQKDNMMWFEHCEPVMPTDNIIFKGVIK